ncbi:MAG: hypothetical protein K2X82_23145 [Gemmataceae bacterium]|nr:hypothetical protein [Gemmataceae bacterium]MBX9626717.1 hypothetical protein [Gemmataceae bacterium]
MRSPALLVALLACGPTAVRGDEPVPAPPPGAAQEPVPDPLADRAAVLTGGWVTQCRDRAAFGMDLMLGQQTGIRPNLAVYSTEHSSVVAEGFYGALFTKFGASEAAGAGARWVTTRGGRDAVTLGPGVDVLFQLNDGGAVLLAPTVDVAWRRSFGDRAAFHLGLSAGVGVGVSGRERRADDDPVTGRVTPLIGFYTGLRF